MRFGSRRARTAALMLAAVGAVIVIGPSSVFATSSAVCEQYPDLPQCESPAGSGGGSGSPSPDAGGTGGGTGHPTDTAANPGAGDPAMGSAAIPGIGDAATGSAQKVGELPFTGYPLTPLVLFLLLALAVGLAARAYFAARGRVGSGTPRPG
jgi:hypothetical protein